MSGTLPKYHWDTCLFYALLKDEKKRAPGEMEGLRSILDANAKGENVIMTSVVALTEILEGNVPAGAMDMLDRILKRENVVPVAIDIRIAKLAGEIRNYHKQNGQRICTADALHVATAILQEADALHTFEKHDRDGGRSPALVSLSGNVAGKYDLKITAPMEKQAALALKATDTK